MKQLSDEQLLDELKLRFEEKQESLNELNRLNKQIYFITKKLEEAEKIKSHFISNVRNEIINPFTSILGLSESILNMKEKDHEKIIKMVKLIYSEAFELDFNLRNLFTAANLEAGEVTLEISNINIKNIVQTAVDFFELQSNKKNIKIIYDFNLDNEYIKTDYSKLNLIIKNIISNAIKFSHIDDTIIIHTELINKYLKITIKDNGIGMTKEEIATIFERFERLNKNINSNNKGSGLGLSIVLELVNLLDGGMRVNSELNKGTSFSISILESQKDVDDFVFDDNILDEYEVF